jgi:hypothetical protein
VTRGVALALAAVLAGVPAAALAGKGGPAPAVWKLSKPVALPALAGLGFVEIMLDADVYREAATSLADLRLRDGNGAEISYVLRRHEWTPAPRSVELRLLDLVTLPTGQTRFSLDLGQAPSVHDRVRIAVADDARNFRVPVNVETSADGRRWGVARAAGFIYAVEGETRAIDTSVTYPPSTARWMRVTVGPTQGRPLPVQGVWVVFEGRVEREEEPVPATIVERKEDAERQSTVLVLDLGGRRPVDRVELDVADRNFHRVVTIEASDDGRQWRWAGSCAISGLETGTLRERQTSARIHETWARSLRLRILNLDDRPLRVAGVRVAGVRRGLVFEAVPGQQYVLDYGNARAPAPRYDLKRALPHLAGERLPAATLGPASLLPLPPAAPWLEAQPLLLGAAMALAVLVLGLVLVRLARQFRASA